MTPLTPAQQLLTLEALELRMSDLTERAEVLAQSGARLRVSMNGMIEVELRV
ncbi:hypothetical protein Q0M94_02095 [Deinococcus radiomollis]|uniref:hypothetical protein n=1 Tax=Deinococcus radiomollis TaxID=468916 RepID=UPI0038926FFF